MRLLRCGALSLAIAASSVVLGCGQDPDGFAAGVVARVDGTAVRYDQFERYVSKVGEDLDSLEGTVMAALFLRFVDQRVLVRMAVDEGLMTSTSSAAVAESLLLQSIDPPEPTSEELSRVRQQRPGNARGADVITLRQLLVSDLAQAESVVAAAAPSPGGDLVDAATRVLGDPSVVVRSTLRLEDLPKELRGPIDRADVGAIIGPIEMQYGVHVFEILERHSVENAPNLAEEELAVALERRRRAVLQQRLEEAWKQYNVEIAHAKLPFVLGTDNSPGRRPVLP